MQMRGFIAVGLGATTVLCTLLYFNVKKYLPDDDLDSIISISDDGVDISDHTHFSRFLLLIGGPYCELDLSELLQDGIKKITGLTLDIRCTISKKLSKGVHSYWTVVTVDIPNTEGVDGDFILRSMNPYLPSSVRVLSVVSVPREVDPEFLCEGTCFETILPSPIICPQVQEDDDDWDDQSSSSSSIESEKLKNVIKEEEDLHPYIIRRFLSSLKGRKLNPAVLVDPSSYPPPPLPPVSTIFDAHLDKLLAGDGRVSWRISIQGCHHLDDKWARLISGLCVATSLRLLPLSISEQILLPVSSFSARPTSPVSRDVSKPPPPWIGRLPVTPPVSTLLATLHHPSIPYPVDEELHDMPSVFLSSSGALDSILKLRSELYGQVNIEAVLQWSNKLFSTAVTKAGRLPVLGRQSFSASPSSVPGGATNATGGDGAESGLSAGFSALLESLAPGRLLPVEPSAFVRGGGSLLERHSRMLHGDSGIILVDDELNTSFGGVAMGNYQDSHHQTNSNNEGNSENEGENRDNNGFLLLGDSAFMTPNRVGQNDLKVKSLASGGNSDSDDSEGLEAQPIVRVTEYVSLLSPDQKKMKANIKKQNKKKGKKKLHQKEKKTDKSVSNQWWGDENNEDLNDHRSRSDSDEGDNDGTSNSENEAEAFFDGDDLIESQWFAGDKKACKEMEMFFTYLKHRGWPSFNPDINNTIINSSVLVKNSGCE